MNYEENHQYTDAEIQRWRIGCERYEIVRRMSVEQFKSAWKFNLSTGKPFDEIIDDLKPFMRHGRTVR